MRQAVARLILLGSAALLLMSACGGGGSDGGSNGGGNPQPANVAPNANVGAAQTVTANTTVTLNGTASSDPDGSIASYLWTQTAGTSVTLLNSTTSQPSFVAPPGAATATLTFSLVVTDNRGAASAPVAVTITVNTPITNVVPTANAGGPQTVAAGTMVSLSGLTSLDPDGVITGYVWTQTAGPAVTLVNANTVAASFIAPQVGLNTTLSFRLLVTDDDGATSAPAFVEISVTPAAVANVTISGTVRYARPQFLNVSPFGLDYANVVYRPLRGVIARALDASTQAVLASGATDANGSYSFVLPGNTQISVQLVARLQRDNAQPLPRWDVRVQDGVPGTAPYTFTSVAFNSSQGTQDVDIPIGINSSGAGTGPRASGPFAVLDTIYSAIQTILTVAPAANFPTLIVDWGSQSAGTFFSTNGGQHIALMADLTEDTDEFDQHVVAHEFGHYVERNFARSDSLGGEHRIGDKLDPRVAFGEGFGYAFSAIVLGDTLVRDTFVDNGISVGGGFSVEINPPNLQTAGPGCWCSETSVWSILWDLYDSVPDGFDTVQLGFAPIWDVLTNAQRTTPAFTSIFSFITALNAARPVEAPLINTLVSGQNISAITHPSLGIDAFATVESNQPLTPPNSALPVYAIIQRGSPVVVRSLDDAGRYNKLGNHRWLRFSPTADATVTVHVTTSNPAASADPDFRVYRDGVVVMAAEGPPATFETSSPFTVTAGRTYLIDVHECANGCSTEQGTPGDYDLTVTIN